MKIIPYLAVSLAALSAFAQEKDREFTSKTLKLKFETDEDAEKWSLRSLGFDAWLKAVAKPEWTELHRSRTDEFYFAIYRSGDHLVFCVNDRKDAYRSAGTSIKAADDRIGFLLWEKPSKRSVLKYEVEYPTGGYWGQAVFTTWQIVDEFAGDIVLNHRVGNNGKAERQVLLQTISWTKEQKRVPGRRSILCRRQGETWWSRDFEMP